MSAAVAVDRWRGADAWRGLFRDRPIIPLIGLLGILILIIDIVDPGIVSPGWANIIVRTTVPLAILAGCQTITMLTGGIDLSVGAVASMTGFVTATLVHSPGGVPQAILVSLIVAMLAGLVTGVGIGVFRVHPLIMTLGMSFVVLGLANVWQLQSVQTGAGVPDILTTLGSATLLGFIPAGLLVLVPVMLVILIGLRRTGYGRLLYAIGDNPVAARLSGARAWQVLIVLYVLSALLAGVGGLLLSGLTNTASVSLADSLVLPSVAAAVIGGTSILGGRGGYGGTLVGALILSVLTALLTAVGLPEPTRQIVFGAIIVIVAAALHPGHRRDLTDRDATARPPDATSASTSAARTSNGWSSSTTTRWRALDRGQVPTPAADGPDAVVARLAGGRRRGDRAPPGVSTDRGRRAGAVRPGHRRDPVPGQRAGRLGGSAGRAADRGGARPAGLAHQRRTSVRPGGAAARRRARSGSMVGLVLGTGVGGVIAIDGRVHLGHDGTAGEVGHQTIDPDGPPCGCGNNGCVEAFARADRIAAACGTDDRRGRRRGGPGRRRAGAGRAVRGGPLSRDRHRQHGHRRLARPGGHRRRRRGGRRSAPRADPRRAAPAGADDVARRGRGRDGRARDLGRGDRGGDPRRRGGRAAAEAAAAETTAAEHRRRHRR